MYGRTELEGTLDTTAQVQRMQPVKQQDAPNHVVGCHELEQTVGSRLAARPEDEEHA